MRNVQNKTDSLQLLTRTYKKYMTETETEIS